MGEKIKKHLRRKGFTLTEMLVVIGIIAILATVVLITLNPAQLLEQGADSDRMSSIESIDKALSLYSAAGIDNPSTFNMGSSSVVYVSIPDPTATSTAGTNCSGLGLSEPGVTFHCAASSTYMKSDGTGWIPINFTNVFGNKVLPTLPVDPINTTSSGNFFTYVTDGMNYEVTANMVSQKFQTAEASTTQCSDLYKKGPSSSLLTWDYSHTTGDICFVQSAVGAIPNGGNPDPLSVEFSGPVSAGDTIIVAIAHGNYAPNEITGCSDTNDPVSSYQRAGYGVNSAAGDDTEIWYASNVAGGSNVTVTCTMSVGDYMNAMAIHEYAGLLTANALDATTASNTSSSASTSWTTGTTTTQANGELIVAAFQGDSIYQNLTVPSPFTVLTNSAASSGFAFVTVGGIQGSAGAIAVTATSSAADIQSNVITTFQ